MKLFFGLDLDGPRFPTPQSPTSGQYFLSPHPLIKTLENFLGLSGYQENTEYLRIEAFRQTIQELLPEHPTLFFATSFQADPFATAKDLLHRRDELVMARWDFQIHSNTPSRLKDLALLETQLQAGGHFTFGLADRYRQVLHELEARAPFLPFSEIIVCDNQELLPYVYRHLLEKIQAACHAACPIHYRPLEPAADPDSDLGVWQRFLLPTTKKQAGNPLRGDGSLLLLHAPSGNEAASFLAKTLRKNPDYRPVCFLPDQARQLDQALIQEGIPSLGILSTSSARPSLQLLKLTPTFLWDPIDPYKVIEFISLAIKPIDRELGKVIGGLMARSPGIQSDLWNRSIRQYFQRLENQQYSEKQIQAIQSQYRFWFARKRYPIDQTAPKSEAISLFSSLQTWAYELANSDTGHKNPTLYVLAEQAKRIKEILEALPESEISNLQLEQIVRTIYEPSPVTIRTEEQGRLPHVQKSGAILAPLDHLLWWNFTSSDPDYFFSRWYRTELQFLADQKVQLETPDRDNQRVLKRRIIPILQCTKQLILVVPEQIHGVATHAHPLFGDLQACFSDLQPIEYHTRQAEGLPLACTNRLLPEWQALTPHELPRPIPFIKIRHPEKLSQRSQETYTSLQALFYYPYQWLFRHQLKLRPSSILSVVKDQTLMGNLAHRLFEKLLSQPAITNWERIQVQEWVAENLTQLFLEEGSVLLLYGREPERVHFRNTLQWAAWALVEQMQTNQWTVRESEMVLEGTFAGLAIKGIADLVLERGSEQMILDLKWRGASYREREIKNEEDLQLSLYAFLLGQNGHLPHTAYFIINKARILARNNAAFQEITGLSPHLDAKEITQRILQRMEATYEWRNRQIQAGQVEIRCNETLQSLEDHYAEETDSQLLDLLEMKNQDAVFDDYRTLIGLSQ